MPLITLETGRLSREQKEALITGFTKLASETLKIPEQAFLVLLKEHDLDNIGSGGQMLSKKLAAQSKS